MLAVDSGTRAVRLLLVRYAWGNVRILRQEVFDFEEEGLVGADEFRVQLQSTLDRLGHPPLAISLPEYLATSQVLHLQRDSTGTVQRLVEDEAFKLAGVSETPTLYDFVPLPFSTPQRRDYWVTLCRTSDVEELISQLGLEREDVAEVSTSANALIAAYLPGHPAAERVVLVHLGATHTVAVGLLEQRGVFAASFAVGGNSFARAVVEGIGGTPETAEMLKRTKDLFADGVELPALTGKVDAWADELRRQLEDWLKRRQLPSIQLEDFRFVACGRAFDQPGLRPYLQRRHGFHFQPWESVQTPQCPAVPPGFEIALGTALLALRQSPQPISVLPPNLLATWRARVQQQWLELASMLLLLMVAVVLGQGVWQTFRAVRHKERLLNETRQALAMTETNAVVSREMLDEYARLRPVLVRQERTADTLEALALLEGTRSNQNLWYVLVADADSYFATPPETATTNAAASEGASPVAAGNPELFERYPYFQPPATNGLPQREGLIAEFCLLGSADSVRSTLSQVVNSLQSKPLFARVDLLSDDLRRKLADPAVIVADRHFALSLEFKNTDFGPAPSAAMNDLGSKSGTRPRRLVADEASVRPPARSP